MNASNERGMRPDRSIRGLIRALEARLQRQRELLANPRLELAAARQMARTQRRLAVLRRNQPH
ncbi:MAG TPA: hypothetical protein VHK28_10565 [Candidatus Limnocylindria bacterium]|nr:hypothetical protein [Candidatus Limnocylindria bacterium]